MQIDAQRIDFRPVVAGDYALLRAWLEKPHMREWWGDPDEELALIREMVEGRDTTRPSIILLDDHPVGYIQAWFVGDNQTTEMIAEYPWIARIPADAVGVDLSLGEENQLSRGIGTAAVSAFVRDLIGEGFSTIVIDPDVSNQRAVRAYTKAGFRPIEALLGQTGDVLVMQYDLDTSE